MSILFLLGLKLARVSFLRKRNFKTFKEQM